MASRPTASTLATFTGRAADDPAVLRVLPVAQELLERYYHVDPWTDAATEACLHAAAYLLTAQQTPTGVYTDALGGAVYLPGRLPVLDRLLPRRGGFA